MKELIVGSAGLVGCPFGANPVAVIVFRIRIDREELFVNFGTFHFRQQRDGPSAHDSRNIIVGIAGFTDHVDITGQFAVMTGAVALRGQTQLFEIIQALRTAGRFARR